MTGLDELDALRGREMFQHFDDATFARFKEAVSLVEHADGEIIHSVGVPLADGGQALMIVLSGTVRISTEVDTKTQVPVARMMKAGELAGLVSFARGGAPTADSRAVGDVRLAVLTRKKYDELKQSDAVLAAAVGLTIAKQLARDLRACNRRLANALYKGINRDDLPSFVRR